MLGRLVAADNGLETQGWRSSAIEAVLAARACSGGRSLTIAGPLANGSTRGRSRGSGTSGSGIGGRAREHRRARLEPAYVSRLGRRARFYIRTSKTIITPNFVVFTKVGISMTLMNSFRRVGFNFGAQIYTQFVNISVQILLVPVLLRAWGPERYGVWLLLSAIPTYLTFTDFGFTLTAKNEMTIKAAKGDTEGALVTYQSVLMLLSVTVAIVVMLAVAILSFVSLGAHLGLGDVSEGEAKFVVFLLGLNVLVYQYIMLLSAGARAVGRPAAETALAATARLVGGVLTGAVAILGGGLEAAAIASFATNLTFVAVFFVWVRQIAPWLRIGWAHSTRREVMRLFKPSISFMSQSVGQAVAVSGPVVVLGMLGMPLAVVVFSTSRTLARLGTTATNMIGAALIPEYSRVFGSGEYSLFRHLASLHSSAALGIACIYSIFLYIFGGWILRAWTHGEVRLEEPFFTLLLVSVAFEMLWTTIYIPVCAINRHVFMANTYGLLVLCGVVASYFLAERFGLTGVIVPFAVANVVMIGVGIFQVIRQLPRPSTAYSHATIQVREKST